MAQRFITGLFVFDTYLGQIGSITQMDLSNLAVPPLAPYFTGAYFVAQYTGTLQTYTTDGRRVDHMTGLVTPGATLLTQGEYTSIISAGYPTT